MSNVKCNIICPLKTQTLSDFLGVIRRCAIECRPQMWWKYNDTNKMLEDLEYWEAIEMYPTFNLFVRFLSSFLNSDCIKFFPFNLPIFYLFLN